MHLVRSAKLLYVIALALLIILAGCAHNASPSQTVQVDELQVRTIVNDMLTGYNRVDYAAFCKDFSPALKLVIDETSFKNFYAASMDTMGQYKSIPTLEQVNADKNSSTWLITAKFQHSTEFFHITINADSQIEGMDFGPAK